jgi:Flp pilus assembly protein TadG
MSPLAIAWFPSIPARLARWRKDSRGVAAVEFALLAPIMGVILAGAIDFGGVVFVRFGVENAVSAGANFAIVNAAKADATNGTTLANNISAIVASSGYGSNSVVVNNGPTATYSSNTITPSGTASNANSCYCPSIASSTVTWGSAATCGSACAGGGVAGKFVRISATRNYTPFFFNYGIVTGGTITVRVMVQVQ